MSSEVPPGKGQQETAPDAHKDASRDVPPTKATGVPPVDDDFFRTFRRFTDYHFSHMMQSVFGLPSMYTPPPSSGWMVFEEGSDGSWRRPNPDRIMSELEKKEVEGAGERRSVDRAGSDAESDVEKRVRPARFYILRDPFGFGPEHFGTAGRTSSYGPGGFTAVRAVPLPPQSVLDDPASRDAFFQHHKNQIYNDPFFNSGMGMGIESLFYSPFSTFPAHRSFFGPSPFFWGFGFPYHHIPWEAFPPPGATNRRLVMNGEDNDRVVETRQESPGMNLFKEIAKIEDSSVEGSETAANKTRRLVSTTATTVSTLGADGVMHTKYALRKRFSDGTEEVEEREYDDQGHGPWGLLKDGEQRFKEWTKRGEEGFRELAKEGETAWKNVWDKGKEVLEELTGGKEGGNEGKRR